MVALIASCGAAISAVLSTQSMQQSLTGLCARQYRSSPRHDGSSRPPRWYLSLRSRAGKSPPPDLGTSEQIWAGFRKFWVIFSVRIPTTTDRIKGPYSDTDRGRFPRVPRVPRGHAGIRGRPHSKRLYCSSSSSPNQVWLAGHIGHSGCYTGHLEVPSVPATSETWAANSEI